MLVKVRQVLMTLFVFINTLLNVNNDKTKICSIAQQLYLKIIDLIDISAAADLNTLIQLESYHILQKIDQIWAISKDEAGRLKYYFNSYVVALYLYVLEFFISDNCSDNVIEIMIRAIR